MKYRMELLSGTFVGERTILHVQMWVPVVNNVGHTKLEASRPSKRDAMEKDVCLLAGDQLIAAWQPVEVGVPQVMAV